MAGSSGACFGLQAAQYTFLNYRQKNRVCFFIQLNSIFFNRRICGMAGHAGGKAAVSPALHEGILGTSYKKVNNSACRSED